MPADSTRTIRYFVSYAHKDKALVANLLDDLGDRLAIACGFAFERWMDSDILVGERWRDAIQKALDGCDLGLLLLSPAFFASGFIRREELPALLSRTPSPTGAPRTDPLKPLVPVILKPLDLDGSADLAGLEQIQCFRDSQGRAFSQTRGPARDAFAAELTRAILAKLGAIPPGTQG